MFFSSPIKRYQQFFQNIDITLNSLQANYCGKHLFSEKIQQLYSRIFKLKENVGILKQCLEEESERDWTNIQRAIDQTVGIHTERSEQTGEIDSDRLVFSLVNLQTNINKEIRSLTSDVSLIWDSIGPLIRLSSNQKISSESDVYVAYKIQNLTQMALKKVSKLLLSFFGKHLEHDLIRNFNKKCSNHITQHANQLGLNTPLECYVFFKEFLALFQQSFLKVLPNEGVKTGADAHSVKIVMIRCLNQFLKTCHFQSPITHNQRSEALSTFLATANDSIAQLVERFDKLSLLTLATSYLRASSMWLANVQQKNGLSENDVVVRRLG